MNLHHQHSSRAEARSGMTLIEMLVSVGIAIVIITVALALIVFATRSFMTLSNYHELNRKSRNAMDLMSADVRTCKDLISYVSNSTMQQLVFKNLSVVSNATVTYTYSATDGTLTRTTGGEDFLLVSNINSLSFSLSSRVPSTNFTFYPTAQTTNAKLISVQWQCSRPVYGTAILNSESIQNAKIVIRN
jgi:type II secretory pathway pseudopilin PulG